MNNYLLPVEDGLPMRKAGPWAREKLDYLARYIAVFGVSMRGKWPVRNYVDLLAGPGKNRVQGSGQVLLGSPLLALMARYPFTGYYFVELKRANADALRQRCEAWRGPANVCIQVGDCNKAVDQVVAELARQGNRSLNLAFLDPEGLELEWETVRKLASVRRMDLIINYPQNGVARSVRKAFLSNGETTLDRFFGDAGWRAIYDEWRRTRRFSLQRRLIDLYRDRLGALGYVEVQGSDELGDEPLVRNARRNAPLYRLLFASKHPLGSTFWHEVTARDVHGQRRLFER